MISDGQNNFMQINAIRGSSIETCHLITKMLILDHEIQHYIQIQLHGPA